jgi:hypothetical protein
VDRDAYGTQVKAARNQSLFREVNERVKNLRLGWAPLTEIDFVCECADDSCIRPIGMTVAEHEEVRTRANRFFVLPGHIYPEVEVVVAENERFWTVEKIEDAAAVAGALDPRRATEAAA